MFIRIVSQKSAFYWDRIYNNFMSAERDNSVREKSKKVMKYGGIGSMALGLVILGESGLALIILGAGAYALSRNKKGK